MRGKPFLIGFAVALLACVLLAFVGFLLDPPKPCWPTSWFGGIAILGVIGSLVSGAALLLGLVASLVVALVRPHDPTRDRATP